MTGRRGARGAVPARLAVLLAVLAATLGLPAAAVEGCEGRTAERSGATGTWASYALPEFTEGPAELTAHTADPADATRWWATNGVAVVRSTDSGCTWEELLVLPEAPTAQVPASRGSDRIRTLAAAQGRLVAGVGVAGGAVPGVTFELNGERPSEGTLTVVLTGTDELAAAAPLTAPAGPPGPVAVAPSDPDVLYAVAGGRVHASEDGGASWRLATPPSPLLGQPPGGGIGVDAALVPQVSVLAVDPLASRSVWAQADGRVFRSDDAGRSYDLLVDVVRATFPVLEVARTRGTAPRATLVEQPAGDLPAQALLIADDGTSFARRPIDVSGVAQSGAAGPGRTDLVLTTSDPGGQTAEVYVETPAGLLAVDEFRLGPLLDVERAGTTSYVFRGGSRLVRWTPPAAGPLPPSPPPIEVGAVGAGLPPLSAQTVLSSPVTEVRLRRGESVQVPLTLDLSPEPTPVDVFFLLDTSGSMDDVVAGLAAGFAELARELGRNRIDAQFGLAEYQDWRRVRYRRLLPVAPPGEPLRRALESIRTAGGDEPAYTALHQMVTGSGIADPSIGQPVEPGQDAGWRDGALRVVVHATDERVSDADPAGPRKATVLRALQRAQVRHVGIEVVRPLVRSAEELEREVLGPGELHRQLAEISTATGAFAPPGGVDCEGDGDLDLRQGDPLVCGLFPGGGQVALAEPLRRVLSTLEDVQPVSVAVGPADRAEALAAQVVPDAGTPDRVDVKQPAQLGYALRLTCGAVADGTTSVLSLQPQVGARRGSALPLRVVCGTPPAVAAPPPAPEPVEPPLALPVPAALPALAVALPPPPPPPPAPANAPAPAGAPAAAPAGAPAVNPAPGLATMPEEQQVQLAFAEQQAAREREELAMVDRREQPDTTAVRLLSMTLLCAAATAVATRRRSAVRTTR